MPQNATKRSSEVKTEVSSMGCVEERQRNENIKEKQMKRLEKRDQLEQRMQRRQNRGTEAKPEVRDKQ